MIKLSCPERLGCCVGLALSLLAAKTGLCALGLGRKERKPKTLMSWGNLPPAKHEADTFWKMLLLWQSGTWICSGMGVANFDFNRNFDFRFAEEMAQTVLITQLFLRR